MSYDLVRQKHPDAPAVIGARVMQTTTGRHGQVIPACPGIGAALRVRFDGEALPRNVDPESLVFASPSIVTLRRPS